MRFLITIILIALLAALFTAFLPWWTIGVAAFIIAFISGKRGGSSFLAGFLAIFLFWFVWSVTVDARNGHLLSSRMAVLFKLPGNVLFMIVSALVGGLVGGFSAWSGAAIGRYLRERKRPAGIKA